MKLLSTTELCSVLFKNGYTITEIYPLPYNRWNADRFAIGETIDGRSSFRFINIRSNNQFQTVIDYSDCNKEEKKEIVQFLLDKLYI